MNTDVRPHDEWAEPRRPKHESRTRLALGEFLLVPLLVVGIGIVLAVITSVLDRQAEWLGSFRRSVVAVFPPEATSTLLETVTPGLVTIVSIIYFVSLMTVQHQSSNYSPVVLDQFLRRRSNQLFFGTFVGLMVYSVLVLALVPSGTGIISGALALVLASVTFVGLLVFVYSTVDQLRPSSALRMLWRVAVRARTTQLPLLAHTRARPVRQNEPSTQVLSRQGGYLVGIDRTRLVNVLAPVADQVEIELLVSIGDRVFPGCLLAEVRGGDDAQRARLARVVLDALTLGRMRNIDRDAAHVVDHLGSIGWTATATSGDPEGARISVHTLHSLLTEFQDQDSRIDEQPEVPLVYHDRIVTIILDRLTSVIVASAQSGQHQTCSEVFKVLSDALPSLEPANQRNAVDRLQRILPVAQQHVFTPEMHEAFAAMQDALYRTQLPDAAQRVEELKEQLDHELRLAAPARQ